MKFNSNLIALLSILSATVYAEVDPICESSGSLPITRYSEGKPEDTKCISGTGFCANDGGYYECKDNKYVKDSCKCPGRVCRKKAMFIECEKVTPVAPVEPVESSKPVDPACEGTASIPITRYSEGKPEDTKCVSGTGFCANDGGYYECKDNKYVKDSCKCPGRVCRKKAMFIECEKVTPVAPVEPVESSKPVDPACEGTASIPITRYSEGKPEDTKCVSGTGFCANDGGYYECKDDKYVKGFCKCPGRVCRKKAMFIECEKVTPVTPVESETPVESAKPVESEGAHGKCKKY